MPIQVLIDDGEHEYICGPHSDRESTGRVVSEVIMGLLDEDDECNILVMVSSHSGLWLSVARLVQWQKGNVLTH